MCPHIYSEPTPRRVFFLHHVTVAKQYWEKSLLYNLIKRLEGRQRRGYEHEDTAIHSSEKHNHNSLLVQ